MFDVFEGCSTLEGAKIAPKTDFGGLEASFGANWGFIGDTLGRYGTPEQTKEAKKEVCDGLGTFGRGGCGS